MFKQKLKKSLSHFSPDIPKHIYSTVPGYSSSTTVTMAETEITRVTYEELASIEMEFEEIDNQISMRQLLLLPCPNG